MAVVTDKAGPRDSHTTRRLGCHTTTTTLLLRLACRAIGAVVSIERRRWKGRAAWLLHRSDVERHGARAQGRGHQLGGVVVVMHELRLRPCGRHRLGHRGRVGDVGDDRRAVHHAGVRRCGHENAGQLRGEQGRQLWVRRRRRHELAVGLGQQPPSAGIPAAMAQRATTEGRGGIRHRCISTKHSGNHQQERTRRPTTSAAWPPRAVTQPQAAVHCRQRRPRSCGWQ